MDYQRALKRTDVIQKLSYICLTPVVQLVTAPARKSKHFTCVHLFLPHTVTRNLKKKLTLVEERVEEEGQQQVHHPGDSHRSSALF